ncbi:MAG: OmpH family outer membrane protein [Bacteroides sp.]|nr:OmpH family outer membrane protein [Bacteroides sp.]
MKRINYLLIGLVALIMAVLFVQCDSNQNNSGNSSAAVTASGAVNAEMKIAFVEIDTLLLQYNFWVELNEMMMRKEESIVATLNQKRNELETDLRELQRKYENNALTPERLQQEQARLMKKQEDLQNLNDHLYRDLSAENSKNTLELRDSINSFLKEYNKTKGYSMIITNTGFDNLLYADENYNITQEIVAGLNARYSGK